MEGIKVSQEEIEEEIERLLDSAGPNQPESLRSNLESDDSKESLEQILIRRKALQRLVEVAKGEHRGIVVNNILDTSKAEIQEVRPNALSSG